MLVASPASFPKKVLRLAPDARLLPAPVPPKVLLSESLLTPLDIPVKLEPSPYSVSKYPFLTLTVFVPISKALSDVGTKWLIIFQPAPYLVSLNSLHIVSQNIR